MKIAQAFARQAVGRARANANRMAAMAAGARRRAQRLAEVAALRRDRIAGLKRELEAAVAAPLSWSPHEYANGARALFFETNWTSPDAVPRVVFMCNTVLPGSQRPAATFLWTEDGVEPIDLSRESLTAATSRGRLFVIPSSATYDDGRSFAVRPATFYEHDDGPAGLWCFATAGRYRGNPFLLSHSGVGAFIDPVHRALLVVRPWRFDPTQRCWIWAGRSSARVNGRLKLVTEALLDANPASRVEFLVSPASPGSDIAAFRCTAMDERGDPLGVVDTRSRPLHGIVRRDRRLFFFARPNYHDQQKRAVFALRAIANADGDSVVQITFAENGEEVAIELPANHQDTTGQSWFVQRPNAKDREGFPIVFIGLENA